MIQAMRAATKVATEKNGMILARYFEDHPDLMAPDERLKGPDATTTTYAVQAELDRLMQPVVDRFDSQASTGGAIYLLRSSHRSG